MATASLELLADSSQIRTATKDLDRLSASGASVEKSTGRMNKNLDEAGKAQAAFSRKVSQSTIQLEQFFGQVNGGGNIIQAASYQLADLGIVLGNALPFALGAITLSLGNLIFSSEDATSALDDLEDIADTVGKTLEQAADGSDIFSESIQRLATRSEALARVQIAQTISELEGQISTSAQGIRSAVDDFAAIGLRDFNKIALESGLTMEELAQKAEDLSGVVVSNLNGDGLVKFADAVDFVGSKFDISTEQAIGLASAISEFQNDQGPVGIARLRREIETLEGELGAGNTKFNQFAAALLPFFDATRTGVDRINLLRQAIADLSGTVEENSGKTDDNSKKSRNLTASLQAQIIALTSGAEAAELFAAGQAAISNESEALLPRQVELIQTKYELKRAQEAAAESAKLEIEQQKAYESVLGQIIAKEKQRQGALQNAASGTIGLTSVQQLEQSYTQQRDFLLAAQDEGIASKIAYEERLTELERQYTEQRNQIQNQALDARLNAERSVQGQILGLTSSVFGEIADTIEQSKGKESAAYKVAFLAAKGAAIAQAIIQTELAAVSALAPPPLGLGPVAGAPYAQVIRGLGYASVGIMAGQAITGFEKGGYTGNYGTKEVAGVVHGQEFVMNARATRQNRGALEAMNSGKSFGGDTYVNVTNNATNSEVSTEERQDAQGNRVIDIVVNNINQRGKIPKAMTQTTTAGNRI